MIWVLVCINMYRYERNFGSFSTAIQQFRDGKWVNTDLMADRRFLLKYNDREKFYHRCVCVQVRGSGKMWKSNVKNIFSYNFPRWPVGVKSYRVVLKLLRNDLRPVNKTAPN